MGGDLQDNRLRWSHFAFAQFIQLRSEWPDFCGGGNRMSLTLNPDLVCFLLGELVGFPPPLPHEEVAVSFLLSCKEPCRTFHTSYSGMGLVCVCVEHGSVRQQHFGLLWSRVVQFPGMFGSPRTVWVAS